MSIKIDARLVTHVASLANLELTPGEVAYYETQLTKVIDYIAQLERMPDDLGPGWRGDLQGEPTPERPDVMAPSLPPDVALAEAPQKAGSAFQVPRIIE